MSKYLPSTYYLIRQWGMMFICMSLMLGYTLYEALFATLSRNTFRGWALLLTLSMFFTVRTMQMLKYYTGIREMLLNMRLLYFAAVGAFCMFAGTPEMPLAVTWQKIMIVFLLMEATMDSYKLFNETDNLKLKNLY